MQKPNLVFTVVLMLLLSAAAVFVSFLPLVEANFLPAPAVIIYSPAPITYQNNTLPLRVTVHILSGDADVIWIKYSVDGKVNATIYDLVKSDFQWFAPDRAGYAFIANATLKNLSEGSHTVQVYAHDANGYERSSSVTFKVDKNYSIKPHDYPKIALLSPINRIYHTSEVPLTFTVDDNLTDAYYYLANQNSSHGPTPKIPIEGNTSLTELPDGIYDLQIVVYTEQGYTQEMVHFTVDTQLYTDNPNGSVILQNTLLVAIAVVAIVVVLFFAIKRYRRQPIKKGAEAPQDGNPRSS